MAATTAAADMTPFKHLPAGVSLDEYDEGGAWGAADSPKMDFREADVADEQRLNKITWRSVGGAGHAAAGACGVLCAARS